MRVDYRKMEKNNNLVVAKLAVYTNLGRVVFNVSFLLFPTIVWHFQLASSEWRKFSAIARNLPFGSSITRCGLRYPKEFDKAGLNNDLLCFLSLGCKWTFLLGTRVFYKPAMDERTRPTFVMRALRSKNTTISFQPTETSPFFPHFSSKNSQLSND